MRGLEGGGGEAGRQAVNLSLLARRSLFSSLVWVPLSHPKYPNLPWNGVTGRPHPIASQSPCRLSWPTVSMERRSERIGTEWAGSRWVGGDARVRRPRAGGQGGGVEGRTFVRRWLRAPAVSSAPTRRRPGALTLGVKPDAPPQPASEPSRRDLNSRAAARALPARQVGQGPREPRVCFWDWGAAVSRLRSPNPAGNAQNHPSAAVYKARGVPRREGRARSGGAPSLSDSRPAPHQAASSPMRTLRPGPRAWHSPDRNPAAALER